ncbi:MAG: glycoside hydrolase family 57 protein, partial [Bacteroidetes bacterium]|nr:glycoside hydrolase family 57 protein [Bacteroidota bacterium]
MSETSSLKVLFLWHHHQPYYKTDGSFLLPWVRMHAVKDYWDMVRILDDYPAIKQTFNFAPSLIEQIQDYLKHGTLDVAMALSRKDPASFTDQEKIDALDTFFMANAERMVKRYPRYNELLEKRGLVGNDLDAYRAAARFTVQDFRDLQVWWNLSWVGEYSRFDPPFKYYLDKQRDFSEKEKQRLLDAEFKIMARIIPSHIEAAKRRQIAISVSPFYHPILPLLCDSSIAAKANPRAVLPDKRYRRPEDADHQVKSALDYGRKTFGFRLKGMWPSEGSLSDEALKVLIRNGVAWTATDEAILRKTLAMSGKTVSDDFLEKYFPYDYVSSEGSIRIFFRDHGLSDLIGFVYSRWSPDDAAHNLISRLLRVRDAILSKYGEKGLAYAVVPIILDGENAWEFYQSDGKDFLRTLYHLLSNEARLETVLPTYVRTKPRNVLKQIEPGSWINGNFDIWIGQQEDNKAWDLLHDARETFAKKLKHLGAPARAEAYRQILIAEGSDWCWWYGDEHKSVQAGEFDKLFRHNLKELYLTLGLVPPPKLDIPIKRKSEQLTYRQPLKMISPKFGAAKDIAWDIAGFVEHTMETGAMQKTGMQIRRVYFGN